MEFDCWGKADTVRIPFHVEEVMTTDSEGRLLYGEHWISAGELVKNNTELVPGSPQFSEAVESLASARAAHAQELLWRVQNGE